MLKDTFMLLEELFTGLRYKVEHIIWKYLYTVTTIKCYNEFLAVYCTYCENNFKLVNIQENAKSINVYSFYIKRMFLMRNISHNN